MQLAFSDGSHIVDNPAQSAAAHRRLRGIGGVGTTAPLTNASIASIAAQGATTTATILGGISAATTAAGSGLLAGATVFGMAASAALPLIGAAIAGLTAVGIAIAKLFAGCGRTCVEATTIANQVGTYLQQNLQHYMSSPVHYASLQAAALNNFDTAITAILQACGDPSLGQAGKACISERAVRGGPSPWCCNSPTSTPAGQCMNGDGSMVSCCTGCDYYVSFRDPIANDPNVVPDTTGSIIDSATGSTTQTSSASVMPLLLIGGGIAAAVLLLGND